MRTAALLGGALAFAAAASACSSGGGGGTGAATSAHGLRVPEIGPVPELPSFPDDPLTDEKRALGTAIFFDERLSRTGTTNCNSCHLAATAFQDNLVASTPDRVKPGTSPKLPRNTLSFLNLVYAPVSRWDGSLGAPSASSEHAPANDLLDVLPFPFAEANMDLGADVPSAQVGLKDRLTVTAPGYVDAFQRAYGVDIRALPPEEVWHYAGRALRAFVSQAVSRDSAFDRWNAGDDGAMSEAAVRGLDVFRGKGRCIACHTGPMLTDYAFHNVSTSPPDAAGDRADEGRWYLTRDPADRGRFLTPTLRGAYDTGPYFHSGHLPDGTAAGALPEVISFFASDAVTADPAHDRELDTPVTLTPGDQADLVAFVKALRGAPPAPIARPAALP